MRINTIDADGIALLAIQALEQGTRELEAENEELRRLLAGVEARLGALERQPD